MENRAARWLYRGEPIRARGAEPAHQARRGRAGKQRGAGLRRSRGSPPGQAPRSLLFTAPPPSPALREHAEGQVAGTPRRARRPLTYGGPCRRDDDHGIGACTHPATTASASVVHTARLASEVKPFPAARRPLRGAEPQAARPRRLRAVRRREAGTSGWVAGAGRCCRGPELPGASVVTTRRSGRAPGHRLGCSWGERLRCTGLWGRGCREEGLGSHGCGPSAPSPLCVRLDRRV
jgi:hypothetical protein